MDEAGEKGDSHHFLHLWFRSSLMLMKARMPFGFLSHTYFDPNYNTAFLSPVLNDQRAKIGFFMMWWQKDYNNTKH